HELCLELSAGNTVVRSDPARLQQIFWNILRNAWKFTPDGGTILVRTMDCPGNLFHLEFKDYGIGIPVERLPKIFDTFEQGGEEVTRQYGGLGLGLAISRNLINLLGGTLWASSGGAGTGSTFSI